MTLKSLLGRYYTNLRGWRSNRKIVVIESDDWGSIRMPSREVYEKCLKSDYRVDQVAYERYDSLASEDDLELLYQLLTSFKDIQGRNPVITANCVVANPDFDKIEEDNFTTYHYESITETFKRYPEHHNCLKLWKEGMQAGIFHPQFHAREHLNVSLFMEALQNGDPDALFGFHHSMPGCMKKGPEVLGNYYVEATKYSSPGDKEEKLSIFLEGLDLFESMFGFHSKSIIPPNYIWSQDFNEAVLHKGVKYFQGLRKICEPRTDANANAKCIDVYQGMMNQLGQTYLVRNAMFEPSLFKQELSDPIAACLSEMDIAFRMRKPAIIGSHRLNYVGFIDPANRDRTLQMLHELLSSAQKRWPDLEFLSSDELGEIMTS